MELLQQVLQLTVLHGIALPLKPTIRPWSARIEGSSLRCILSGVKAAKWAEEGAPSHNAPARARRLCAASRGRPGSSAGRMERTRCIPSAARCASSAFWSNSPSAMLRRKRAVASPVSATMPDRAPCKMQSYQASCLTIDEEPIKHVAFWLMLHATEPCRNYTHNGAEWSYHINELPQEVQDTMSAGLMQGRVSGVNNSSMTRG